MEQIHITDVSPRDGLQNQPRTLAPAERIRLYCNDRWLNRCRRWLVEGNESTEKPLAGRFFRYLQVFRPTKAVFIELASTCDQRCHV